MPSAEQSNSQKRRDEEGAGPVIGAIIIVILLVFGALYFWGQKLNKQPSPATPLVHAQTTLD